MNLLLDLGHSRLKWSLDDDAPLAVRTLDWRDPAFAVNLDHDWRQLESPARIFAAASTDHPGRELLAQLAQQRFGLRPEWLSSPPRMAGVSNAYADPARLGIDRFLGLLGAWSENLAPCVIADFGTALTLDALTGEGHHLGGVIVPGLGLMRQALVTSVPTLAASEAGQVVDCAVTTGDAMASGSVYALAGAVDRFYRRLAPRLGGHPNLLLCGGDAQWLATQLEMPSRAFDHAVIRGMRSWCRHGA